MSLPDDERIGPDAEQMLKIEKWFVEQYGRATTLNTQFFQFLERQGIYKRTAICESSSKATPLLWWKRLVGTDLACLALEFVSIIPSSAAAGRCWSSFGFIHSNIQATASPIKEQRNSSTSTSTHGFPIGSRLVRLCNSGVLHVHLFRVSIVLTRNEAFDDAGRAL